jgi:hypothetical protein
MKRFHSVLALVLLAAGCDTSGPSINTEFPAFYLQNIDTGALPTSACFLGEDGDIAAAAGTSLFFIDSEAGYVRAEVKLGVPITAAGSSPEGGYGLALSGNVLYVISNDIYTVHSQILLPEQGVSIIPRPYSTVVFVMCADGSVAKLETVSWTITQVGQTDVSDPVEAVMGTSGDYIFAADQNGTVFKISTADYSTAAQTTVQGGINGMCSTPLGEVFVSPAGKSEVWAIDCGTGQHSRTFSLPGAAGALAVTGSGKYLYAAVPGQGFAVVNTAQNKIEAVIDGFGDPVDIAVNSQTTRAVLCTHEVFVLQR